MSRNRMLWWFNLCSGLCINFHKSGLVGVNVDEMFIVGISGVLKCRGDTLPINYLGLPLGSNPNRISTWKPVLSKIHGRLGSRKDRLLSLVGRACLIKSVLAATPLYYMSIFCIPKTVTHQIIAMQSSSIPIRWRH
jgi:hypothetical protein